jgi:hypothetical protein
MWEVIWSRLGTLIPNGYFGVAALAGTLARLQELPFLSFRFAFDPPESLDPDIIRRS